MGGNYSCLEGVGVYSKREMMPNNAHDGALDKTEI